MSVSPELPPNTRWRHKITGVVKHVIGVGQFAGLPNLQVIWDVPELLGTRRPMLTALPQFESWRAHAVQIPVEPI